MHRAVRFLIDRCYRDIVVEDHFKWTEHGSCPYENERTTLVARNGAGEPVRIFYWWTANSDDQGIERQLPIVEAELQAISAARGFADTPEARLQFEQAKQIAADE